MKININTIILSIGILLVLVVIWFTRPVTNTNTKTDEYHKIDSVLNVIEKRQLRDSIRMRKTDSLLSVVSNNNKVISNFANELKKINKQLDQTLTNINGLNADELIILYTNQLPKTSGK